MSGNRRNFVKLLAGFVTGAAALEITAPKVEAQSPYASPAEWPYAATVTFNPGTNSQYGEGVEEYTVNFQGPSTDGVNNFAAEVPGLYGSRSVTPEDKHGYNSIKTPDGSSKSNYTYTIDPVTRKFTNGCPPAPNNTTPSNGGYAEITYYQSNVGLRAKVNYGYGRNVVDQEDDAATQSTYAFKVYVDTISGSPLKVKSGTQLLTAPKLSAVRPQDVPGVQQSETLVA